MENALLVLCPTDPGWTPPEDRQLDPLLHSIELIGERHQDDNSYLVGDRFLELVAFMGCSPDIRFAPDDSGQPFCHIRLITGCAAIEFHGGEHTHAPRCPHCRAAVDNWRDKLEAWLDQAASEAWRCGHCGQSSLPWQYNWRKSAGFGRCFIEIDNVYPREAIPQQALLDTLHSHYGLDWHYFYQY